MSIKRPRRENYASEPAWHAACLSYLDLKWPGREGQRKRIAAWARWEIEHDVAKLRARILTLIDADDWTPAHAAEFDRLATIWRNLHRSPSNERKHS